MDATKISLMTKITTIILTWNSADFIEECLNSLLASTLHTDILIVDNDSADNTRDLIKTEYPTLELINTGANLGYAGGNNYGINHALRKNPDAIFILNPDATVEPDCIERLVATMQNNKNIAGVSPMICRKNTNEIWYAGSKINWKTGMTPHIGAGDKDIGQYNKTTKTERLSGCAMLLDVSTMKKVGLMDENYFLYYEETDWSARYTNASYELSFEPKAKAFHQVSASTGGNTSAMYQYYMTRNRLYFVHKFKPESFNWFVVCHGIDSSLDLLKILRSKGLRQFWKVAKARINGGYDYFHSRLGRRSLI